MCLVGGWEGELDKDLGRRRERRGGRGGLVGGCGVRGGE